MKAHTFFDAVLLEICLDDHLLFEHQGQLKRMPITPGLGHMAHAANGPRPIWCDYFGMWGVVRATGYPDGTGGWFYRFEPYQDQSLRRAYELDSHTCAPPGARRNSLCIRWRNERHPEGFLAPRLRLLPSLEAEQAVLGGLMLDNSTWELVGDRLADGDIFRHEHRLIFRAITVLAQTDSPFDVVTLAERCESLKEVGGLAYLGELAKNTPSVANIKVYAEIVRERAHLRRLIQLGHECSHEAATPQADSLAVQALVEQKLFALGQDRSTESAKS